MPDKGLGPSVAKVRNYMPDMADVSISPLGLFGKYMQKVKAPDTLMGVFNPLTGGVEMNTEYATNPEYGPTMVHELTHARQRKEQGFLGSLMSALRRQEPYGRRPNELEAHQVELDYLRSQGIPITSQIRPSWDRPDQYVYLQDINLR